MPPTAGLFRIGAILPLLLCAIAPNPCQAASPSKKPNILLIVADDLGYGDLGCYGSRENRTPNLDRLAKEGVRLTDAYASAPVCSPTRASLITGRYPQRAGFEWVIRYTEKDRGLPVSPASLPRRLQKAGYATGLFGKWHLGYKESFAPNAHGFDEFFGFLAADLDYYSHRDANGDPGLYENTKLVQKKGYLTDLITEPLAGVPAKERPPAVLPRSRVQRSALALPGARQAGRRPHCQDVRPGNRHPRRLRAHGGAP